MNQDPKSLTEPISAILDELARACTKHPEWPDDLRLALLILLEEAGEVAKAVVDWSMGRGTLAAVRGEAEQVGAMAVRFLAGLNERGA